MNKEIVNGYLMQDENCPLFENDKRKSMWFTKSGKNNC